MKLPTNYVPGVGVKKATGFGGIGQRLLERQGWKEGQGLGKDNSGMAEALEVKEKKDVLGVGAAGGWNWSLKFWEEAYNSAAQGIQHDGSSSSTSTSVDSDSSEDEATPSQKKGAADKQVTPTSKQEAAGHKQSDSSSSSSDSDSDEGAAGKHKKHKKSRGHSIHRDGTIAGGASAAELAIAAELAKDPWGRWGGKAGKMARIRQQEEEAAARARAKLGLPPVGTSSPASQPQKKGGSSTASKSGKAGRKSDRGETGDKAQPEAAAEPPKRIVVTLTIPEDKSIKRGSFVRTPATGWWGATYFTSAGALEGMEEAGEHVSKKRKTFDESDQANLYMQAHLNQRVGHKGLGKSTTVNVAGGKWEGTKKTFDEEDQQAEPAANQAADAVQGCGELTTAENTQQASTGPAQKDRKKKKGKGGSQEGVALPNGIAKEETGAGKKGKQKKRSQPSAGVIALEAAATPSSGQAQVAAAGPGQTQKEIKWLKVIKVMLKQAPKRRLKLQRLCKQLVQHAAEHHSKHHEHTRAGLQRSYSQDDVTNILHKKAKKSKVIIEDGFVSLPAASSQGS